MKTSIPSKMDKKAAEGEITAHHVNRGARRITSSGTSKPQSFILAAKGVGSVEKLAPPRGEFLRFTFFAETSRWSLLGERKGKRKERRRGGVPATDRTIAPCNTSLHY